MGENGQLEPVRPSWRASSVRAASDAAPDVAVRYRRFIDHVSDALFVHDARDGRVVDVSPRACELLGYAPAELIGAHPSLFDPDVTNDALAELMRRLAAGETVTFESRHRRRDGSVFPVEIRIRSFVDGADRLNIAAVRETGGRQHHHDSSARLAAEIAGELNNTLTVITANADLLVDTLPASFPARADIAAIAAAGRRAGELTAQLLAISGRSVVDVRPEVPAAAAVASVSASPVVLLVDDEAQVLGIATRILERAGYVVHAAASAEQALAIEGALEGPLDLLLTDVSMPGMGGGALASAIRARRPDVRIAYVSGSAKDELERQGIALGRDGFVSKPFSAEGLRSRVRELLGK